MHSYEGGFLEIESSHESCTFVLTVMKMEFSKSYSSLIRGVQEVLLCVSKNMLCVFFPFLDALPHKNFHLISQFSVYLVFKIKLFLILLFSMRGEFQNFVSKLFLQNKDFGLTKSQLYLALGYHSRHLSVTIAFIMWFNA